MPKDFKIGMTLGMVLVIIATLWLATRPSPNPQARTPNSQNITSPLETSSAPNNLSTINNRSKQPDLTVYEQAVKIKTQRFHIVRKGETLSAISVKYYGSASKWQKIFDSNRNVVKDASRLKPGTKLIIPD